MDPPAWATTIIADQLHAVEPYGVHWSRAPWWEPFSSGSWMDAQDLWVALITVEAGWWELDQRRVLLHEIAHALTPGVHSPAWWELAKSYYRLFRIPWLLVAVTEGVGRLRRWRSGKP